MKTKTTATTMTKVNSMICHRSGKFESTKSISVYTQDKSNIFLSNNNSFYLIKFIFKCLWKGGRKSVQNLKYYLSAIFSDLPTKTNRCSWRFYNSAKKITKIKTSLMLIFLRKRHFLPIASLSSKKFSLFSQKFRQMLA